jgi:tetratricopeptide (TPR) repeat protein
MEATSEVCLENRKMAGKNLDQQAIFEVARKIDSPEARQAYLEQICGDDLSLQQRIQALLRAYEENASFLESPPSEFGITPTFDQPITERPGTVIGRYKLLEQIGEGGFGVVFMAEQEEPVRRKVALKIIKPGMDTKEVIARFEAERQALAIMDHPNIAKVLDAGATESGRPYFVMELVRGIPITTFCDQNGLTTRERLELFASVCQAVQHAHQKGIIHRDIKPTNVLVTMHDDKPVPKVIDFGVAKATNQRLTDRTLFTKFAQMIGTPLYMSPEQAQMSGLDVDTRSDIYSLGVLLYELLTGTTPFDQKRIREAAYDELLRIIREEEPPRPSLRISTLGDTLPSVAAHRKVEPKRLSALVRGELDWIVMKALEKDRTRRYETANGFAADVQRYLEDEPVQACPPSAAYRCKKFARRNKTALSLAGLILFFLVLLGGGIGWAVRDRAAREQEITWEREAREQEITWEREAREQEIAREQAARQARMSEQIGLFYSLLGDASQDPERLDRAIACHRRAIELDPKSALPHVQLGIALALKDPGKLDEAIACHRRAIELDPKQIWAYAYLGKALAAQGKSDEAMACFRQAIEIAPNGAIYGLFGEAMEAQGKWDEAIDCYRQALELDPKIAWVHENLGDALRAQGKLDEAIACYRQAIKLDPKKAGVHGLFGEVMEAQGKWDEAIACYRKAIELDPRIAWVHGNLGSALNAQGKPDEAMLCFRQALELDPKCAGAHVRLAYALITQGKSGEAIPHCRQAIELMPKDAWAHVQLGNALYAQGKLDEAIACYRQAIKLDPKNAGVHGLFGELMEAQGKWDEAIACYRKAIELDPKSAGVHVRLAYALITQGKSGEAIAYCRQAIELMPKDAWAHVQLGNALYAQGKSDEAITCYRKAIEVDPKAASPYVPLGLALNAQGKRDEAIACFRQALECGEKCRWAYCELGDALRAQGKLDEAIACFRKAIECDPKSIRAYCELGDTLRTQGKSDEAIACCRQAIERDPKDAWPYCTLGTVLRDQGKLDEALACYRQAIELDPKQIWAYAYLGEALKTQGKLDEAMACYRQAIEKAVQLDPKGWWHKHWWSVAAYRLGDWKAALDARQEKLRRRPIAAVDRLFLAMTHWQLGDKIEARKWYDEAMTEIAKDDKAPDTDLSNLRQEAEQLLGITTSPTLPDGGEPQPDKPRPDTGPTQ